jgi:hypothetical protein
MDGEDTVMVSLGDGEFIANVDPKLERKSANRSISATVCASTTPTPC